MVVIVVSMCWSAPASAQNWSFDARKIALGNAGGSDHPASRMIDEEREYRAIVLPFGLLQVLRNTNVVNPDSDEFDIVRSVEYAAAPLHYIIGRDNSKSDAGRELSLDIRNATLSRDLNTYRGFVPTRQPTAEGLTHTTFGGTIPVVRGDGGSHGIYVGAGPYFSMRTSLDIDQQLIDILASTTNVYRPNAQFRLGVASRGQTAMAFTGGYRGRFAISGAAADERDGVYVALDYNYLVGFRYENVDTALRLDTDAGGLLTLNPFAATPLVVGRDHTSTGRGFAVDLGLGVVARRVEVGFGVKGLANRIDWTDVMRNTYSLGNLFLGNAQFIETGPLPIADVSVELPRDYHAYTGYNTGSGLVVADFGRGFQGTSFHGGYEHRFDVIEPRVGALYTRGRWQPTAGIGLNMGERVSLDVAVFGTSANVERERRAAIAASLRFNSRQ